MFVAIQRVLSVVEGLATGMVDINSLVWPPSDVLVTDGVYINDRGEVSGMGLLPNGDVHPVALIPIEHRDAPDGPVATDETGQTQAGSDAIMRLQKSKTWRSAPRGLRPRPPQPGKPDAEVPQGA